MRVAAGFGSLMVLAMAAPSGAHAQQDVTALGSYRRARAVLDSAFVAMGGAAWRTNNTLTFRMAGNDYARLQSRAALPPYDAEPRVVKFVMDKAARRYYIDDRQVLPGFVFWSRRVIEGNRQFTLDHNENTFTILPNAEPTAFNNRLFALMPPELISIVLARHAETLRWLGTSVEGGRTYDVVSFARDGVASNITVDRAARTVRRVSAVIDDNMTGDGETQRIFSDYQKIGAMLLPTRITEVRSADTIGAYRLDIALTANVPDSSYQTPPGYNERKPGPGPARRDTIFSLAPDVYLVAVGYNLLAVAFDDHVFVVEAPAGFRSRPARSFKRRFPTSPSGMWHLPTITMSTRAAYALSWDEA